MEFSEAFLLQFGQFVGLLAPIAALLFIFHHDELTRHLVINVGSVCGLFESRTVGKGSREDEGLHNLQGEPPGEQMKGV